MNKLIYAESQQIGKQSLNVNNQKLTLFNSLTPE